MYCFLLRFSCTGEWLAEWAASVQSMTRQEVADDNHQKKDNAPVYRILTVQHYVVVTLRDTH